ncbi:MAG: nucleotidyltransferase family protein [Rhodospirillales bacterium]
MTLPPLSSIQAVILAGGLGTRLQGVLSDRPKALAPIHGRPFIDFQLAWLRSQGIERFVFCLGHRAGQIRDHLAARDDVVFSVESEPLGTGGAIRHARHLLTSDPVLVLNGDSWLEADLRTFLDHHNHAMAPASMVCCAVPEAGRFGRVDVQGGHVQAFAEKDPNAGAGLISAGIYLLGQSALDDLDSLQVRSIEQDYFARLPAGTLAAHVEDGPPFIDIGTPESLRAAEATIPIGAAP